MYVLKNRLGVVLLETESKRKMKSAIVLQIKFGNMYYYSVSSAVEMQLKIFKEDFDKNKYISIREDLIYGVLEII